jgi:hypothetical protein
VAGLAWLSLTGLAGEPPPQHELMLRAPVVVTKGGLPDIGRLVAFTADKYNSDGAVEGDARMTADKFTDFLGYADYLFGYSLEYDEETEVYTGYARAIGTVEYDGAKYADTVWMPEGIGIGAPELQLETLRVNLPAK